MRSKKRKNRQKPWLNEVKLVKRLVTTWGVKKGLCGRNSIFVPDVYARRSSPVSVSHPGFLETSLTTRSHSTNNSALNCTCKGSRFANTLGTCDGNSLGILDCGAIRGSNLVQAKGHTSPNSASHIHIQYLAVLPKENNIRF